jgi:hypothetical protein
MVHKLLQSKCVEGDEYRPTLTYAVQKFVDAGKVVAELLEDFQPPGEHSTGRLSGLFRLPFGLRQPDYLQQSRRI